MSPAEETTSASRALTKPVLIAVILLLLLVFITLLGARLYAKGGGSVPDWFPFESSAFDPLAPSDAEESVLRSIRLAGIERAVVGEQGGTAVLRLDIPEVSSAADMEIAWQTGVASLTSVYPDAREYIVQLFENQSGLLEIKWAGSDARDAVSADDAEALRSSATFIYLSEEVGDE